MTDQKTDQPKVLTVGELKKYLDIYHDDLPATVTMPSGEIVGILDASTAVIKGSVPVLVFMVTTIKATSGKKVEPVVVGS